MKTKQQKDLLAGKLLSYSAAAGAVFAIGQDAEAQVAYTDVDPDVTLQATEADSRDTLNIDFNNDEVVDVTIIHGNGDWYSYSTYFWRSVRALNGSGAEIAIETLYATSFSASYYFANRFDKDEVLGPDLNWYGLDNSYQLGWWGWSGATSYTYTYGPWADGTADKYLGVRFSLDEGSTFHYGWVRLDVAVDQVQVTVKDYAYEQTAGTTIKAGDIGGTPVESLSNNLDVKVFSYEKSIVISDLDADNAHADIYNTLGQLVRSTPIQSGRTEIQMDTKGMYIVKLKVNEELLTGKVIVK